MMMHPYPLPYRVQFYTDGPQPLLLYDLVVTACGFDEAVTQARPNFKSAIRDFLILNPLRIVVTVIEKQDAPIVVENDPALGKVKVPHGQPSPEHWR